MNLKNTLLTRLRAASNILMGQGPAAATAAIQKALNGATAAASPTPAANAPTMRDINPPPRPQPATRSAPPPPPQAAPEAARPTPTPTP
ncbi:MAG: hypothetical protein QFF03_13370, partial [Pseudomonadota bacterium]|nr:hypothetical protein [Pseudomonadota bacterium]